MVNRTIHLGWSGGGGAGTTWDNAHKTNATLSNGNLTTTHSGGGNTDLNTFSIAANTSSQKVYFEMAVVQMTFSGLIGISSDNTSSSRTDGTSASPTKGAAVNSSGVYVCTDSVDTATTLIGSWTAGDNIDVAFDSGSKKFWVRKNNGGWNVSVGGTQDPATGQGGVTVTNTPSTGPWYAFVGADAVDGDGFTATFSASSWARTAPSGFTQLA